MSNAYAKLPHEIREMCDQAEAAADFIQWCVTGEKDEEGEEGDGPVLIDGNGNPWPIDIAEFKRWEQAIRSLKQMVMNQQ